MCTYGCDDKGASDDSLYEPERKVMRKAPGRVCCPPPASRRLVTMQSRAKGGKESTREGVLSESYEIYLTSRRLVTMQNMELLGCTNLFFN